MSEPEAQPRPDPPFGGPAVPPAAWVSSSYFAEGFPYAVVNNLSEVLFTELGASIEVIGLTALLHLPWNLKFLWGPLLDSHETKRRWLVGVEVLLSIAMIALALLARADGALGLVTGVLMVMAFLAATHDIAIDGYYLEGLDERGQSRFVGYRAMAYKVASLLVRGPGIMLIGAVGWRLGLLAMAGTMVLITVFHAVLLPRVERRRLALSELLRRLCRTRPLLVGAAVAIAVAAVRHGSIGEQATDGLLARLARAPGVRLLPPAGWLGLVLLVALVALLMLSRRIGRTLVRRSPRYAAAFVNFLEQPRAGRILAFVVLFRLGESFLQKMKWPFLRGQLGMSLDAYGFANGTLGVIASFGATLVGGWLISRHGLRRFLWPFVIAQNCLNLLYVGLALLADGGSVLGLAGLTSVIALEQIGEGLGTAVFMVYLMRCCDPAHKAAHMAILTALMSLGFTVAGSVSGVLARWLGFATYFGLSFAATIPAMVLIVFIPHIDGREGR